MRRELFIHFAFWFSFFILLTLVKNVFNLNYWSFWVGGLIGTFLPDIDHLLHVWLIKPAELTSIRFNQMIEKRSIKRGIELLYETRNERKNLIFHSNFFQVIFFIVTFWLMSSSGSIFGKGLALAFALHLSVDQLIDMYDLDNFDDLNSKIFWLSGFLITVVLGLLL